MNIYNSNWDLLPFCKSSHSNYKHSITKPINLEKMISIVYQLCILVKNPPFVRIDIINKNNLLYFGEFSYTPAAGKNFLKPIKYDNYYGHMINFQTYETINNFVFIIPSFNNQKWYQYNLDSVNQIYKNRRIIYIDDASKDNTYQLVKSYIEKYNLQSRCTLLKNDISMKQAYSRKKRI